MVWTSPGKVSVTIEKEKDMSHTKKGDTTMQAEGIGLGL
jgi:hypothetical protein